MVAFGRWEERSLIKTHPNTNEWDIPENEYVIYEASKAIPKILGEGVLPILTLN